MQINDFLDIRKSQPKALCIVPVSRVNTIELFKDLLEIFFLYTDTCVSDRQVKKVIIIPSLHIYVERTIGTAVFNSIIHQIEDCILEMHLIDIDL